MTKKKFMLVFVRCGKNGISSAKMIVLMNIGSSKYVIVDIFT